MNKKSNVIMLHGWTNGDISEIPEFLPDSKENWMGWTKKQLEAQGYKVDNPFLRDGYKSDYEGWKRQVEKLDINENTILVGWSSGGALWVRWLGETKVKVKKLILVAPAKVVGNSDASLKEISELEMNPEWRLIWNSFHDFECDTTIKDRVSDIKIFISDDASWLIEAAHLYATELEAKLVEIKNQGHFTKDRRPSPEFPELLEAILK
ncbi:MAG TPA: alpha/beta hydrolase [Patescibacteria group bacterium]|nr:alpha/beta hydrolase [Patescibacteria group bacterium]